MSETEANKRAVREMIDVVWRRGGLDALPRYWIEDCLNHADPAGGRGLDALRSYHETFMAQMTGLSDVHIEVLQQVGEGDRVVTQLLTRADHTGRFLDVSPTGRRVSLSSIRIDRMTGGKIVEHWSVADVAGLLRQLEA